MESFEALLLMLLAAVVLLGIAKRIGAPYPALLAVAGATLALTPFEVPFHLDPQLALALFVAPVLMDAAFDASTRDLRQNIGPVIRLVLVAVGLTTTAVAVTAHFLVPEMPWAAAIALGAIVAPPDAAAATTILRSVRLPHRLSVILEGESLLNDASALLVYRLAVAATISGGTISAQAIAPAFLLSVVGSLAFGPLLALVWVHLTRSIRDAPSATILQFVSTFGVWIVAEALELSPILAVVSYAIMVARYAPAWTPAALRVPSYAVWDTAVVVLSALAFILIGFELGAIIRESDNAALLRWIMFSAVILLVTIVARLVWVMGYNVWLRVRTSRRPDHGRGEVAPPWQGALVISWCGMRGIVTVATALALPPDFPERDLILFTAFAVTLGTLVLQGGTLRPLLVALDLHDDGPIEREIRRARIAMADVALAALDGNTSPEARTLKEEIELERQTAKDADEGDGRPVLPAKVLRGHILAKRREKLLELRRSGTIGDEAFHRLEEELDFADLAVGSRT